MRGPSTLVIVFGKAPQAGRVKTRLAPLLGDAGAARLHARLLVRAVATARAAACGPVELHGSPAGHGFLRHLAQRNGIRLAAQSRGDVGDRMFHAFRGALRRHRRVILIGSDCPSLVPGDLRRAARMLQSADAVIAPAEDGGYPLIGLRRVSAALFEGVEWSTAGVVGQTRARLTILGWRWRELRTVWDVDRPDDVARLHASGLLSRPATAGAVYHSGNRTSPPGASP